MLPLYSRCSHVYGAAQKINKTKHVAVPPPPPASITRIPFSQSWLCFKFIHQYECLLLSPWFLPLSEGDLSNNIADAWLHRTMLKLYLFLSFPLFYFICNFAKQNNPLNVSNFPHYFPTEIQIIANKIKHTDNFESFPCFFLFVFWIWKVVSIYSECEQVLNKWIWYIHVWVSTAPSYIIGVFFPVEEKEVR